MTFASRLRALERGLLKAPCNHHAQMCRPVAHDCRHVCAGCGVAVAVVRVPAKLTADKWRAEVVS
jgi:hypothetical protein